MNENYDQFNDGIDAFCVHKNCPLKKEGLFTIEAYGNQEEQLLK